MLYLERIKYTTGAIRYFTFTKSHGQEKQNIELFYYCPTYLINRFLDTKTSIIPLELNDYYKFIKFNNIKHSQERIELQRKVEKWLEEQQKRQ